MHLGEREKERKRKRDSKRDGERKKKRKRERERVRERGRVRERYQDRYTRKIVHWYTTARRFKQFGSGFQMWFHQTSIRDILFSSQLR